MLTNSTQVSRLDEPKRRQSSYSSASCRSVAPFSTWLHGSDARNERDLGTNKWQGDKVHKTVRLNETNTPNERVAGAVEVRRQEQLGNEQLGGAQDLPQGLLMGTLESSERTRRWTCSLRPARPRETTRTSSTRHAERSIITSMSASRGAH